MSKRWLVAMSALAQLSCCIARGARVKTPRGDRNIEDLGVGDEVVVVDPVTREQHVGLVSAVRSAKRECAVINTSRGSLRLTPSHPLFDSARREWAPAGDWILGLRSALVHVDGDAHVMSVERFVGIDDVFDVSVSHPLHTFVADGVVVHNKQPLTSPCTTASGDAVRSDDRCSCPLGDGFVVCRDDVATCACVGLASPASAVSFSSRWAFALGDSDISLRDGSKWSRLRCGDSPRALTVIGGDGVGWFDDQRLLAFRERGDCFLEHDLAIPDGGSTWGQLWFLDNGQDTTSPRVVSIDDDVLLAFRDSRIWLEPKRAANGQPAPSWYSWNQTAGWQRYEWRLEVLSSNTYRVWPRFRVGNGAVKEAGTFVAPIDVDGGLKTLAAWYAEGNAFSFADDAGVRALSLGHQSSSSGGETVLHVADFALSNEGWVGP